MPPQRNPIGHTLRPKKVYFWYDNAYWSCDERTLERIQEEYDIVGFVNPMEHDVLRLKTKKPPNGLSSDMIPKISR